MRNHFISLIFILSLNCAIYGQTLPSTEELSKASIMFTRWFSEKLENENDLFPGSLYIGNISVKQTSSDEWNRDVTSKRESDKTIYSLMLTHKKLGITIRYEAVLYNDFPVIEWTAYYKNIADKNSPILQELKTIDTFFTEFKGHKTTLYRNKGDNCIPDSYAPIVETIEANGRIEVANTGGRPTQTNFPYFNFHREGEGVIFVISWAGQWACQFKRDGEGNLYIQGGQEHTHFVLYPKEEVRGPMVVLMYYTGDKQRGQNLWRQWMIKHNLPSPNGAPPKVPLLLACSSHQYGEMVNATTETQLMFIDKYIQRGFLLDYWWMDAGWYPCDGQWPKTGTWEVDQKRFPGGFKPISEYAHKKGIKILVWFEPERVHSGTWLAENHPEWIIGGKEGGLLNLGNVEAREWLINHIDSILVNEGIDLYRQDFNIDPLDYWCRNDTPDRQGITEIKHIEGYYAFWDELLRRHPNMLIDSCASGGRRNNLETLRRALPLLRSDYIMEPIGNQCHTWALSEWFPFYGTGTSKTSDYEVLSVLCPSFTACFDQRRDDIDWQRLQQIITQRNLYAENYYGDYYPLTPYSLEKNVWIAWEFNLPSKGTGFVQVFRREEAEADNIKLRLIGLEENTKYRITFLERKEKELVLTGKELMENGLPIILTEKPSGVIVVYKKDTNDSNN